MWYSVMLNMVIKALPIERIIAKLFNWLLNKYLSNPDDIAGYDNAITVANKVNEQVAVVLSALEDRVLTDDEVTQAGAEVIKSWAKGKSIKHLEEKALRK